MQTVVLHAGHAYVGSGSWIVALDVTRSGAARIEGRTASTRSFLASYLFAEIAWRRADGFGDSERLDMSDNQFLMGLAFDFL
jgi:hypothetical protein